MKGFFRKTVVVQFAFLHTHCQCGGFMLTWRGLVRCLGEGQFLLMDVISEDALFGGNRDNLTS